MKAPLGRPDHPVWLTEPGMHIGVQPPQPVTAIANEHTSAKVVW